MDTVDARQFRLLVVDDTVENRTLLHRYFGNHGFQVFEAEGGATALALLGQQRFDAVLLDIVMPGMDGLEVLKLIRTSHSSGSLPVIMVSGKTASRDFALALKMGANGYITKPIDLAGALGHVRGHLPLAPNRGREEAPRKEGSIAFA